MDRSSSHNASTSRIAALEARVSDIDKSIEAAALQHYRKHLVSSHSHKEALHNASIAISALEDVAAGCSQLSQSKTATAEQKASSFSSRPSAATGHESGVAAALDVLELPALIETCVRQATHAPSAAGRAMFNPAEDALDLLDFANGLYLGQRLYRPASTPAAPGSASSSSTALLDLVTRARFQGDELAAGMMELLTVKPPLPLVLQASSVLRRVRSQQAAGRSKTAESLLIGGQPIEPRRRQVDDAADTLAARFAFLAGRDVALGKELVPQQTMMSMPAQQQILRLLDAHRSHGTESANHFTALMTAIGGSAPHRQGGAGDGAGNADLQSRESLTSCFLHSLHEVDSSLAALLGRKDEGNLAASVFQQLTYTARRSGRLGIDYQHVVATLVEARLVETLEQSFTDARRRFAATFEEVCRSGYSQYSESGVKTQVGAVWAELSNSVCIDINTLRGVWSTVLAEAIAQQVQNHVEAVVAIAEEALAACPHAAVTDAVLPQVSAFVDLALSVVDVCGYM